MNYPNYEHALLVVFLLPQMRGSVVLNRLK